MKWIEEPIHELDDQLSDLNFDRDDFDPMLTLKKPQLARKTMKIDTIDSQCST